MSDLSGFTDELDEALQSSEEEANAASTSIPCAHSCGMPMEQGAEPVAQGPDKQVKMNFLELTMTASYREHHETALKNELLKERKLALVLDLDHTLLHTVMKHPSAGRMRLQGAARLNGHIYHPPVAVKHQGPIAVPDPRRTRGPGKNRASDHSTPSSEAAKSDEGTHQGKSDEASHEESKPVSSACEKESNGASASEDVEGIIEAGPTDDAGTNLLADSQPQGTADPVICMDDKGKSAIHESSTNSAQVPGAEGGSDNLESDTAPCKDAGDTQSQVVSPPAVPTEHLEDTEQVQRAPKRARVHEQSCAAGSEAEANGVEGAEKKVKVSCPAHDAEIEPHCGKKEAPAPVLSGEISHSPLLPGAIRSVGNLRVAKPLTGRIDEMLTDENDATKTPPGEFEFPGYWTKLRPGAREMLHDLQDTFRFYIFTMGDKAYAESMARLLDPKKRHFRSRIVNRSDAVGRSLPGNGTGQPQLMVKSLQQVGISGHVAAVLDDTSEVWKEDASNLLRVQRYHWFPAINNDGTPGIGPTGLAAQNTDDDPVHGTLGTISQRLREAHRRFFEWHDQASSATACGTEAHKLAATVGGKVPDSGNASSVQLHSSGAGCQGNDSDSNVDGDVEHGARKVGQKSREACNHAQVPDVRVCLHNMRQEVLQGCRITFSKILDEKLKAQPHQSAFWQLASSLGAQCCDDLEGTSTASQNCSNDECKRQGSSLDNNADEAAGVGSLARGDGTQRAANDSRATHVVSLSRLTDKARQAQHKGVALVSPDWLLASEINWKKADEQQFPVPETPLHSWLQMVPAEHIQALRQLGDIAAQMQGSRVQRTAPDPERPKEI